MEKKIATKKQISRWLAVSLAAVMTVTAAGCGSGSGGSSATEGTTAAAQTAQTSAETTAQAAAGTAETAGQETQAQAAGRVTYEPVFTPSGTAAEKYTEQMDGLIDELFDVFEANGETELLTGYDEPVTVDMMRYYSTSMETGMAGYEEKYGESYSYNRWEDLYKRLFNVDINMSMRPSSDYSTQLSLDMAALDLPDIFIVSSQSDLMALAEEGLLADMSGYIDEYASAQVKANMASDDGAALRETTMDGKIFAIPCATSATNNLSLLWIRSDWLKNLGMEAPTTVDELETVIDAFMTKDPDGNGVDDTWGFAVNSDTSSAFKGLYAAYGSYPNEWHEDANGEIVYGGTTEATKNALAKLAEWYKKGYIDPEYITTSAADANAKVADGTAGMRYYNHSLGKWVETCHESDPNADWICVPLPSATGSPVKSILAPYNVGYIVVNKDFEHPELVFKMLNVIDHIMYNSADYVEWWAYDDEVSWNFSPVGCYGSAFGNLDIYLNVKECYDNGEDTSLLHGGGVAHYRMMHDENDGYRWVKMFGPQDNSAHAIIAQQKDSGNLFWASFTGPNTKLMNDYWTTLMDQKSVIFKSIINGEVSADEGFAQWLDFWDNMHGNEITQEVRDWCAQNAK